VLDRNYSYDGMGNITEIDRNSMTDDLVPVYPYSYEDDYSYSASSIMQIDNGDLTQTHAYYAHNILGDVTVTRQYAIQGELTKELRLTWNDDHRLTEVKDGANQTLATYTYNGLGQRVKKAVAGGDTTIFLFDLQGNIISEMRSDGTYDDYLYLEDQRIAKITSNGESDSVYYFHNDHLGTPIAMTDSLGSVVWKAAYKAFGEAQVDSSSAITNNFRFPGQYFDEETGLHYNYHRYYDPGTGRYLTPDPIGLRGGVNRYGYVLENPLKYIDQKGLELADLGGWGVPTPNEHFYRNQNNNCPKKEPKNCEGWNKDLGTYSNKYRSAKGWSTETEISNAGFNLYRSESENGEFKKLNATIIPAEGSSVRGASYTFTDTDVQNRKSYYYRLEDIDLDGTSTMHGPVSATPRLIYGMGK
jgi:RHS repeat-associated protein